MKNVIKLLKIQIILQIIPLLGLFVISSFLFYYLSQNKDPSIPSSALLNKKVPEFQTHDLLENKITINNRQFIVIFIYI